MLDIISRRHVESDFRRLGGRLYSVDSLQALLSHGLPKKNGTDTHPYFEFRPCNKAALQKFYNFKNWRINPWFKLGKDEPSHHHVTTVERAIATELPIAEVALLKTQARNRQSNPQIELPGVPVIDLSTGSVPNKPTKQPSCKEENQILLATVESLAESRHKSRSKSVRSNQEKLDSMLRIKPTMNDEFDLIRLIHEEIQSNERKKE